MSANSLPAASLQDRFGSLLARVGKRVPNYLDYRRFSTMIRSICGLGSSFLPVSPVVQGRPDRVAAGSPWVVGVLPLAQHHADGRPGQIELAPECVDEVAPIGIGELARLRGEQGESGGSGIDLGDIAQAKPPARDERR